MDSFAQPLGFVFDDLYLEHVPPSGHPECPARLNSLVHHLKECALWDRLVAIPPTPASAEDLRRVHTTGYLEHLRSVCQAGGGQLDAGDTHASQDSFEVARLAVGGVLRAIDAVLEHRVGNAFCAVRPPGHHAEVDCPKGFCLLNNVALGARYAQQHYGLRKIAILDWDVHHGNGTQHIFEEDPSVLYISLHEYPFYPGTGARDERGIGRGKGFTLNIPLPAGTGEDRYLQAFEEEVVPALETFSPDLLMVSAGFDAHMNDPLADMNLTDASYAAMTWKVKAVAPVVSVLEGGYDLGALARSVEQHLLVLGA